MRSPRDCGQTLATAVEQASSPRDGRTTERIAARNANRAMAPPHGDFASRAAPRVLGLGPIPSRPPEAVRSRQKESTMTAILFSALFALAEGTPPAAAPAAAPAAQPAAAVAPAAQPAVATTPQKSLSQQWGLYVFPAKQQTKEVQDKDEFDCYGWAKQSSGIDPLAPAQPAKAEAPPPKKG